MIHASNGAHPRRVFIIGMMGAGKSTVGRLVAGRLGWAFSDLDSDIVRAAGMAIPEIFASRGEAGFRQDESRALLAVVGEELPFVISLGGGAVLSEANRRVIVSAGLVVWLRAGPELLVERIGRGEGRPMLEGDPVAAVRRLERARRPLYEELADLVVDVEGLEPQAVADAVVSVVSTGAQV